MRGADSAQVVGGLEATQPSQLVGIVEQLARCISHVDVERLRLVDPFLAARRSLDDPLGIGLEGRGIQGFEIGGNAVDALGAAIEVLEVGHHHCVPQATRLEVAHQILIDDGELARQIRLDVQVLESRLDAGVDADDVGDGGRGRDGHAVGIAHAVLRNLDAQGVPVKSAGGVGLDIAAALLG